MKALKDYSSEELEKLSDAEVAALYSQEFSDSDVDKMSDEEVVKMYAQLNPEEPEAKGYELQNSLKAMGAQAADVYAFGMTPQAAGVANVWSGGDYTEGRDEYAKYLQELPEKESLASMAGTALGIGASLATPGLGMGQIAKGLGKLGQMIGASGKLEKAAPAVYTAGQLLAQNPGETPGEVSPLQLEERFENLTSVPGMVGMALPVSQGALSMLRPDWASTIAFDALNPTLNKYKKFGTSDPDVFTEKDLGKKALELGLVTDKPQRAYEKLLETRERVGRQIGDFYKENQKNLVDSAKATLARGGRDQMSFTAEYSPVVFMPSRDRERFITKIDDMFDITPDADQGINAANKFLDTLQRKYKDELGLPELHRARVALAKDIRDFDKNPTDQSKKIQAYRYMHRLFGQIIDGELNQLDKDMGTAAVKQLKAINDEYGLLSELEDIAQRNLALSKKPKGPVDVPLSRSLLKMGTIGASEAAQDPVLQANFLNATTPRLSTAPSEIIEGVDNYGDPNMLPPAPVLTPEMIDADESLTPSQRAKLKIQMFKQVPQQ